MTSPMRERMTMTWKTSSSRVVSRPATAMTTMQASQPAIQSAALIVGVTIVEVTAIGVTRASFLGSLGSVQHVVDVEVALVERPSAGERTIYHAHDFLRLDASAAQTAHDFGRLEEFLPVVRTARHPAQDIFCAGDGERPGLGGAVERREEQEPARLHQLSARAHEQVGIGHMLNDLERQHDVEL